ncbi:MAG: LacI family DNA-binding transcriptional regulator, partial [Myxococcales bacterium]
MKRRTCAILIDYYGGDYQLGLIRGAEDAAIAHGYNLIIAVGRWLNAPGVVDATQNDVFRHLRPPGTDALVVAAGCLSHFVSNEQLGAFCAGYAPLPVVSISAQVAGVPSLMIDNRRGQEIVVDHLIEAHRCRRIAYIRGPSTSVEAQARLEGYESSLRRHGIALDPELILDGNFWLDSGIDAARALMARGVKVDALAAANDNMAFGAMDALKAKGVRIPEDVRVVGFDDVPLARITAPSLTTVRQPLISMGHAAIQMLHEQLDGREVQSVQSFELELVQRQSCGCGYRVEGSIRPQQSETLQVITAEELHAMKPRIVAAVLAALYVRHEDWPRCVETLFHALEREVRGQVGGFLAALTGELEQTRTRPEILDQFYAVIAAFRTSLRFRSFSGYAQGGQEDLWHSAILLVGEWVSRAQMRLVLDQERSHDNLRASIERLSTTLTHATLGEA